MKCKQPSQFIFMNWYIIVWSFDIVSCFVQNDYEKVIVVEESSSRYGDDFAMVLADHICVCRPMGKTSRQFYSLTRFLFKCWDRLGWVLLALSFFPQQTCFDCRLRLPSSERSLPSNICFVYVCIKTLHQGTVRRWLETQAQSLGRGGGDRKSGFSTIASEVLIARLTERSSQLIHLKLRLFS